LKCYFKRFLIPLSLHSKWHGRVGKAGAEKRKRWLRCRFTPPISY